MRNMKINTKLETEMNKQVTAELEAAMTYLQLSYLLDSLGLTGMRDWMKAQSEEEMGHAQRFADHMLDRDCVPTVGVISAPDLKIGSAADAFEAALKHEQKVSGMIRDLTRLAAEEGDLDSRPLLDSFLAEQVEEEATCKEILDRLRLAGNDGSGVLRIDAELGQRTGDTL